MLLENLPKDTDRHLFFHQWRYRTSSYLFHLDSLCCLRNPLHTNQCLCISCWSKTFQCLCRRSIATETSHWETWQLRCSSSCAYGHGHYSQQNRRRQKPRRQRSYSWLSWRRSAPLTVAKNCYKLGVNTGYQSSSLSIPNQTVLRAIDRYHFIVSSMSSLFAYSKYDAILWDWGLIPLCIVCWCNS